MNTESQTPVSTGRYQVGEVIYVMAFIYQGYKSGHPSLRASTAQPYIYDDRDPVDVLITTLTVTEHHRVANAYDTTNALEYDGYVLTDDAGKIYHNQYPQASYGQISDRSDRMFHLHLGEASEEQIDSIIANEGKEPAEWVHMIELLPAIQRGLGSPEVEQGNPELFKKLTTLMATVKTKFEEKFPGKTFELITYPQKPWRDETFVVVDVAPQEA